MSFLEFLKLSVMQPNKIWRVIENPMKSSKGVIAFLSFLLLLPGLLQVNSAFATLEGDLVAINQQMPEFSITENGLETSATSGFVYQSDVMTFVFDPTGKTTETDVANDWGKEQGAPVLAMLKNGVYLDTPMTNQYVNYSQLTGLNKTAFQAMVQSIGMYHWIALLVFGVMYFIFNSVYLLVVLYIVSLLVRLLTLLFMRMIIQMPRRVHWQLTVASAVLPVIIYTILDLARLTVIGPGEFLFFAVSFTWMMGIREFINRSK